MSAAANHSSVAKITREEGGERLTQVRVKEGSGGVVVIWRAGRDGRGRGRRGERRRTEWKREGLRGVMGRVLLARDSHRRP